MPEPFCIAPVGQTIVFVVCQSGVVRRFGSPVFLVAAKTPVDLRIRD